MTRPVIGMCTALELACWGVWEQPAALLGLGYIEAVQRAGGLALMLPPDERLAEDPEEALELIDGLLLAGGADIDPAAYGQQAGPYTIDTVPERDAFEIALVRAAISRATPAGPVATSSTEAGEQLTTASTIALRHRRFWPNERISARRS